MHEFSLAKSIVALVTECVEQNKVTHVKNVNLRIGESHQVMEGSLMFCFEMLVCDDPVLSGARLCIETIPYQARCRGCQEIFNVEQYVVRCPHCGGRVCDILSGTEFDVQEIDAEVDHPGDLVDNVV
jgi:hydrogenase nickel incorporation protein HypA/HybF